MNVSKITWEGLMVPLARTHPRRRIATVAIAVLALAGAAGTTQAPSIAAPSDPQQPSDVVVAQQEAAQTGQRVHIASMDDEYSTTYANPDGTLSADAFQAPIRLQRDGGWQDVDYSLEHVDGGWGPKVSPADVVFSDGGDRDAVTLGDGSKQLSLSWNVTLPAPEIDGSTATYDLGDGKSLVLTATADGFEQSLDLAHVPSALPQMRLPFDTSDLTMADDGAGGYVFSNSAGIAVYSMPAPVMYGAARDPNSGEPLEQQEVSASIVQTSDGARLDLTPSLAWLQDPSRTYPVRIDPSIDSVTRGGDTYVQDNVTVNEGTSTMLHVGWYNGHAARAYLRYTLRRISPLTRQSQARH